MELILKVCYRCGKKGHIVIECRSKLKITPEVIMDHLRFKLSQQYGGPNYTSSCGLSRNVTAGAHLSINILEEYYEANLDEDKEVLAMFVSDF